MSGDGSAWDRARPHGTVDVMITTTTAPGHPAAHDRPALDTTAPGTTAPGTTDTAATAAISLRGAHARYGPVRPRHPVALTHRPAQVRAPPGPRRRYPHRTDLHHAPGWGAAARPVRALHAAHAALPAGPPHAARTGH